MQQTTALVRDVMRSRKVSASPTCAIAAVWIPSSPALDALSAAYQAQGKRLTTQLIKASNRVTLYRALRL